MLFAVCPRVYAGAVPVLRNSCRPRRLGPSWVYPGVYAGTMFERLWRRAGNSGCLKLLELCARSHRAWRFRLGSKRRRSVEMQRGRQRSHRRLCGADRLLPWPRGPPTWKRSSRPPNPRAMSRPSRPASRRRQPALRQWIPARRPCFTLAKSLRLILCVLDRVARPPAPRRGRATRYDTRSLSDDSFLETKTTTQ